MDGQGALVGMTGVNALLAVAALGALVVVARRRKRSPYWWPVFLWVVHASLFWGVLATVRLCCGYEGPSPWATFWAAVVFAHAFVGVVGNVAVKMRMDRHDG